MACSAGLPGPDGLGIREIVLYEKTRALSQSPSLAFSHLHGAPLQSEKWNQDGYICVLFDSKRNNLDICGLWLLLFTFTLQNNVTRGSSLSDFECCALSSTGHIILWLIYLTTVYWAWRKESDKMVCKTAMGIFSYDSLDIFHHTTEGLNLPL